MNVHRATSASEVALAWAWSSSVPSGDHWLTATERRVLADLRMPKRAADWRLGRWVAKQAVREALAPRRLSQADIQVLASEAGSPVATVLARGAWPDVALSLSHSGGWGLAAVARAPLRLGCDVEVVEARSDAFVDDYLTAAEARWVREGEAARHLRANLVWSAKESALKALGEGLRMDTRSVEAVIGEAGSEGWAALNVRGPGAGVLTGWWLAAGGAVWTVVADGATRRPRIRPD